MEGVTSRHKEDMFQGKVVVKILLKSLNYRRAKSESAFEAVQLFFIAPFWDLEVHAYCRVETPIAESHVERVLKIHAPTGI